MKTTKPFSTISYNSVLFLRSTLNRLAKNGIIVFWAFIHHEPEEDEKKAHFHVYIEPAKQIDTLALRREFLEFNAQDPDHPFAVQPFQSSKFQHWYWYVIHDPAYLASKGQSRKFTYCFENVTTNEPDYLETKVADNPNPMGEVMKTLDLINKGLTTAQIAMALNTPIRNLGIVMHNINQLRFDLDGNMQGLTYRNGKENHETE